MILTAPDIVDRYWSVEVADAYISNVFYIGTRATEGKGGAHAFVVPNWNGKLPDGVVEHRLPTNSVIVAIRIGVKPGDAEDLKAVNALQDKFAITSLGNWGDPAKLGQASVPSSPSGRISLATWAFSRPSPSSSRRTRHRRTRRRPRSFCGAAGPHAGPRLQQRRIARYRDPGDRARRPQKQLAASPPDGLFRLNYRIYLPEPPARTPGTLVKYLPPVRKVG